MAPTGVAIIGGGIFAREAHLPAVEKTPHLELKAVFSRSLKSAEEIAALVTASSKPDLYYSAGSPAGQTYADLLARSDIIGVIIALPILDQGAYVRQALDAGKHVLAEKPIAENVEAAVKLAQHAKEANAKSGATLAIAENWRFLPSFRYAQSEATKLGKLLEFNIKVLTLLKTDSKWYNTAWRKNPGYQGGFVQDGGIHMVAAARLFLHGDAAIETVAAYTTQIQEHLPPIDTFNAILRTRSGATGTYHYSTGSRMKAFEWDFGFERGSVQMSPDRVVIRNEAGEETTKIFKKSSGVDEEVDTWAQGLKKGSVDAAQTAEQGLADLEFLEKIFRSGEQNGALQTYEYQS